MKRPWLSHLIWKLASLLLAALGTLMLFLLFPVLDSFSPDRKTTYVIREVNTTQQPENYTARPSAPAEKAPPQTRTVPPLRTPQKLPSTPSATTLPNPSQTSINNPIEGLLHPGTNFSFTRSTPNDWYALSNVDQPPQALVLSQPFYPLQARHRKIEGYVELAFVITAKGTVEQTEITQAEPAGIFNRAALRTAKKWRFEPAIKDGQPVAVHVKKKLTFKLRD